MGAAIGKRNDGLEFTPLSMKQQNELNFEKGTPQWHEQQLQQQKQQHIFDDIIQRSQHTISSLAHNPIDLLKERVNGSFQEGPAMGSPKIAALARKFNDNKNYITISKNFADLNKECDAIIQLTGTNKRK